MGDQFLDAAGVTRLWAKIKSLVTRSVKDKASIQYVNDAVEEAKAGSFNPYDVNAAGLREVGGHFFGNPIYCWTFDFEVPPSEVIEYTYENTSLQFSKMQVISFSAGVVNSKIPAGYPVPLMNLEYIQMTTVDDSTLNDSHPAVYYYSKLGSTSTIRVRGSLVFSYSEELSIE